jgi:NDP-sugar pyrophosphorylase family protein
MPRKAVILAAGYGTRMQPLSFDLPKPMMPLWGRPILGHVLDLLTDWGVREVLINLHHQPGPIVEWIRTTPPRGLRVTFSFESAILGTGGALRRAAWFLPAQDPFWMINADVAADLSPLPLVREMTQGQTLAALWMEPSKGPRTVQLDGTRIVSFKTRTPGAPGTGTFCGLQLLHPRILRYIPRSPFSSIIEAYRRAQARGEKVAGVVVPRSYWADIGAPDPYLQAHTDTRECAAHRRRGARLFDPLHARREQALVRAGVRLSGTVAISPGVEIRAQARIANSVIWPGARIGPRSDLSGAVIGTNTVIDFPVRGIALRCTAWAGDPSLQAALQALGWSPHDTTALPLGARSSARSFTRLHRGSRSAILVQYHPERIENTRYAGHARFLARQGVNVPAVLADLPSLDCTVLEDLHDRSLQDLAPGWSPRRRLAFYHRVLDQVWRLHSIRASEIHRARVDLEPPFSPALFHWERDLFTSFFLRRRLGMSPRRVQHIRSLLEAITHPLEQLPGVLVHRDLQSSNIFPRRRQPCFIDFQGMRMGPAVYDLASLLCDPYVMLPREEQLALLRAYANRTPNPEAVYRFFWVGAVQRLAQALGAYARNSAYPATAFFARHIPPALSMLGRALAELDKKGCPSATRLATLLPVRSPP